MNSLFNTRYQEVNPITPDALESYHFQTVSGHIPTLIIA